MSNHLCDRCDELFPLKEITVIEVNGEVIIVCKRCLKYFKQSNRYEVWHVDDWDRYLNP